MHGIFEQSATRRVIVIIKASSGVLANGGERDRQVTLRVKVGVWQGTANKSVQNINANDNVVIEDIRLAA